MTKKMAKLSPETLKLAKKHSASGVEQKPEVRRRSSRFGEWEWSFWYKYYSFYYLCCYSY